MTYKIAFLTYDWNNEVIFHFINGTKRFLELHKDVTVDFVDGFGSYEEYDVDNSGAFQIFNLPYIEEYDAVIIHGNRVWKKEQRQLISQRVVSQNKPCISINYDLPGCTMVGSDNYDALYKITNYLIEDKKCPSFAFVKGLATSKEAIERMNGFLDCCKEHNISDVKVYDGGWEEEYGHRAALKMIKENEFKRAIVCANDDIAFGVLRELQKIDKKVPEDIYLTGFDNLKVSFYSEPRITSVDRNYEGMAFMALDCAYNRCIGHKINKKIYCPSVIVHGTSTDNMNREMEVKDLKEQGLWTDRYLRYYYHVYDYLTHHLSGCETLYEMMDELERMCDNFNLNDIYLVFNGMFFENFEELGKVRHYGDNMYLMAMGRRDKNCDNRHVYEVYSRRFLLPDKYVKENTLTRIYPLRIEDNAIGYILMRGYGHYNQYNLLVAALRQIENTIENIRQKLTARRLNDELSNLYVTDQLSGLYNRFGLEKYGRACYENLLDRVGYCHICFIDIDDMKTINDFYGHESGDDAIVTVANMIERITSKSDDFAMRYGGDEFVIISENNIKDRLMTLWKEVSKKSRDYVLDVSIGEMVVYKEDKYNLQRAIDCADDLMYSVKKKKKMK